MDRQTIFTLSVMAYAVVMDIRLNRISAGAVVAEASTEILPDDDEDRGIANYANEYVCYMYELSERPDWLTE
jgi:hypothetical protein